MWYDQLRESDDGSYSNINILKPKIDYQDKSQATPKGDYMSRRISTSHCKGKKVNRPFNS